MCLIVDANLASKVLCRKPPYEYQPVIDWLLLPLKAGCLAVGGEVARELYKDGACRRFVKDLWDAGRAAIFASSLVDAETTAVAALCRSNDAHVIALARVSGARILCSDDGLLRDDFRDTSLVADPRGRVYRHANHRRLLYKYGHTTACKRARER